MLFDHAKVQKKNRITMFFLEKVLVIRKIIVPLQPQNEIWRGSSAG